MKKSILYIVIGLISVFLLCLVLLGLSYLTHIGLKEEGFKVYDAVSTIKEGQELINQKNIKCIAKDVESVAFIDLKRGEMFFAYNIDHNNYIFYENIKYNQVPEDIVAKYEITPHLSWIQFYGKYIVNTIFVICIVVSILVWWYVRTPKK
ncbi:hypothetical protein BH10BAC5_BH10BAC5_03100 [soil metagenome]